MEQHKSTEFVIPANENNAIHHIDETLNIMTHNSDIIQVHVHVWFLTCDLFTNTATSVSG
jgi:hypothetical protein